MLKQRFGVMYKLQIARALKIKPLVLGMFLKKKNYA
jgi:hypothetical protein